MYDGDAWNYLLEDKLDMKVVRHYLWTHGRYTQIGMYRICTLPYVVLYGICTVPYRSV